MSFEGKKTKNREFKEGGKAVEEVGQAWRLRDGRRDGRQSKVRNKSKVSGRMTENKASGESDMEREWMEHKQRREQHSGRERRKRN